MKSKLLIFKETSQTLSFTKAAEKLYLSQPAVSKSIRSLENEYKTTFFIRKGNTIELTQDGQFFLKYVNKLLEIYAEIDDHFSDYKIEKPKYLLFGASTTISNYIIPSIVAKLNNEYPQLNINMKSGNSRYIEEEIIQQRLDFAIIEGKNNNNQLQYKPFIKDEIVLVTNNKNKCSKTISITKLQEIPIIEREIGSGTKNIIYDKLQKQNITKLNTKITLASTEAIKNYLYNSTDVYALLSINTINKNLINNELKIIEIEELSLERWFYFVSRTGYQSNIMNYFEKLICSYYKK